MEAGGGCSATTSSRKLDEQAIKIVDEAASRDKLAVPELTRSNDDLYAYGEKRTAGTPWPRVSPGCTAARRRGAARVSISSLKRGAFEVW